MRARPLPRPSVKAGSKGGEKVPGKEGAALDADHWTAYRDVYAFVGNELLSPMNRSGCEQGLDPLFWESAPVPENGLGRHGLERLQAYAQAASAYGGPAGPDVPGMLQASVEFAHLFIGPPRPAAAPWETMSGPDAPKHVGYGKATVAMRRLIAEEGLELSHGNRQYEDHIGIELLYLARLCEKAAAEAGAPEDPHEAGGGDAPSSYAAKAAWFISAHPLRWIGLFRDEVDAQRPEGYYSALLEYVQGVLEDHAQALTG